jgi:hypothetical protein
MIVLPNFATDGLALRIRKVLSSVIGPEAEYSGTFYPAILSEVGVGVVRRLGEVRNIPNHFLFIIYPYILRCQFRKITRKTGTVRQNRLRPFSSISYQSYSPFSVLYNLSSRESGFHQTKIDYNILSLVEGIDLISCCQNIKTTVKFLFYFSSKEPGCLGRYNDGPQAWLPEFSFQQGKDFSLLHSVQTGSGAHAASYPVGTGGSFPRGKEAGAWRWSVTSV